MRLAKARSLVEKQLEELPHSKRIIIAHPEFNIRYLVIAEAVESGAFYIRLTGAELSPEAIQSQIDDGVRAQRSESGRHRGKSDLVLDDCDRADPSALPQIVSALLANRGIRRVFLVSRTVLSSVIEDASLRPLLGLIPCREDAFLLDYGDQKPDFPTIEVRAFGRGRVQVAGRIIQEWGGALPRSMCFFLVDKGMVTRTEIFRTFWPDMSVADATNVFHVTKRKVSEVLGVGLTQFGSGFYHLATNLNLTYDVTLFNELYNLSQVTQGAESIDLLERAVDLYRGDFLIGVDTPWVVERRAALRGIFHDILAMLATRYEEVGDPASAYAVLLRASALDNAREDLVQRILRLAKILKSPQDGEAVFKRFSAALLRQTNLEPDGVTRQLYELLRKTGV
ncbi:MAG: hypothetical protein IPK19_34115 [Chloroflexi bacterium]|nr:hypothetical protein [Chloroflexota bacterium]